VKRFETATLSLERPKREEKKKTRERGEGKTKGSRNFPQEMAGETPNRLYRGKHEWV